MIEISKMLKQTQNIIKGNITDSVYEAYLSHAKALLKTDNLIIKILLELANYEILLGKKLLERLIIPLHERAYLNDCNCKEIFKFSLKRLHRRNKDSLIENFFDIIFNPKNFITYTNRFCKHSISLKKFFTELNEINSTSDIKIDNLGDKKLLKESLLGSIINLKTLVFINKFYNEKLNKIYEKKEFVKPEIGEEDLC